MTHTHKFVMSFMFAQLVKIILNALNESIVCMWCLFSRSAMFPNTSSYDVMQIPVVNQLKRKLICLIHSTDVVGHEEGCLHLNTLMFRTSNKMVSIISFIQITAQKDKSVVLGSAPQHKKISTIVSVSIAGTWCIVFIVAMSLVIVMSTY